MLCASLRPWNRRRDSKNDRCEWPTARRTRSAPARIGHCLHLLAIAMLTEELRLVKQALCEVALALKQATSGIRVGAAARQRGQDFERLVVVEQRSAVCPAARQLPCTASGDGKIAHASTTASESRVGSPRLVLTSQWQPAFCCAAHRRPVGTDGVVRILLAKSRCKRR